MKPAWDKLGNEFKDSKTVLIADVDCTDDKAKDVCSKYGVRGYPTIKYFTGSTAADGDKYEGGRDFESLKKFADENLGPSCGPDNLDLCTDEQKAKIEEVQKMSKEDRDAAIAEKSAELDKAEEDFKAAVEKLQAEYMKLSEDKDAKIAEITPGLRLLRSINAASKKSGGKDEL
jgi:protein disulfide-isomerase A6